MRPEFSNHSSERATKANRRCSNVSNNLYYAFITQNLKYQTQLPKGQFFYFISDESPGIMFC